MKDGDLGAEVLNLFPLGQDQPSWPHIIQGKLGLFMVPSSSSPEP